MLNPSGWYWLIDRGTQQILLFPTKPWHTQSKLVVPHHDEPWFTIGSLKGPAFFLPLPLRNHYHLPWAITDYSDEQASIANCEIVPTPSHTGCGSCGFLLGLGVHESWRMLGSLGLTLGFPITAGFPRVSLQKIIYMGSGGRISHGSSES